MPTYTVRYTARLTIDVPIDAPDPDTAEIRSYTRAALAADRIERTFTTSDMTVEVPNLGKGEVL